MTARLIHRPRSRGFTLIELLITISIIGLMASMVLFATYSATEAAKAHKTRALIAKLDAIIKAKWDAYTTRRIPVDFGPDLFVDMDGDGVFTPMTDTLTLDHNLSATFNPAPRSKPLPSDPRIASIAKMRLDCLHDLMRMELPDRWTDVTDPPKAPFDTNPLPTNWNYAAAYGVQRPAASRAYLTRFQAVVGAMTPPYSQPIYDNQGAECLYMIVMTALADEGDSREIFKPGDFADTDGDGFPEFLDAWGKPIKFVRWPVGFTSELQVIGSGQAANVNGGGTQSVTIDVNVNVTPAPPIPNGNFSVVSGAYVGGVVAVQDGSVSGPQCAGSSLARITAYTYNPSTGKATITCTTPSSYTMQPAFSCGNPPGSAPSGSQQIYIFAPDPFDPVGAYPIYPFGASSFTAGVPDTSFPSYATCPLIYSAGPDKEYGIVAIPSNTFSYSINNNLYPFYMDSATKQLIGSCANAPLLDESSATAWKDNIHNHLIGTK